MSEMALSGEKCNDQHSEAWRGRGTQGGLRISPRSCFLPPREKLSLFLQGEMRSLVGSKVRTSQASGQGGTCERHAPPMKDSHVKYKPPSHEGASDKLQLGQALQIRPVFSHSFNIIEDKGVNRYMLLCINK